MLLTTYDINAQSFIQPSSKQRISGFKNNNDFELLIHQLFRGNTRKSVHLYRLRMLLALFRNVKKW